MTQADDGAARAHVEMFETREMRGNFFTAPARRIALVVFGSRGGHRLQTRRLFLLAHYFPKPEAIVMC